MNPSLDAHTPHATTYPPTQAPPVERWMSGPVGPLRLRAVGDHLVGVYFERHVGAPPPLPGSSAPLPAVLHEAAEQLAAYFAGRLTRFALPVAAEGTPLERAVWAALTTLRPGETITYGALAARLERPGAARAVGGANARNPLSIIVPCHRVVGAGGRLTGYAGGLTAKRWLLDHEARGLGGSFT